MANHLDCVLDHVHKLIGIRREPEATDGELLDRFGSRQDDAAFETLVRRHGPMVLRTCRRVLGEEHAAEDAFQATFLVLARKAASIRQRSSLGGWLYEVAYHLALRARTDAARRVRHERRAQEMAADDTVDPADREALQALVDEELHRLPEKYRTPLVLCYLEGKTNTEAARELGWPAGSMSSRLARAREMLRDRLAGRGVALSTCGLALLLGENAAPAAMPAALVHSTVQAAALYAAGQTGLAGLVSGKALLLAEGMLNTMITTKLKLVAALLLAVTLLGTGTTLLVQQGALAADPVAQAAEKKADEAPASDTKKTDLYGDPLPDGALARMGTLRWRHGGAVGFVGFTEGGKQLVTQSTDGFFRVWDVATGKELRRFGKPAQAADANLGGGVAVGGGVAMVMPVNYGPTNTIMSADGKTIATAGGNTNAIQLWDVATGKEIRALSPQANPNQRVYGGNFAMAFSPDGKMLATRSYDQVIRLWNIADGKEIRQIGKQPAAGKQIYFYNGGNNTLAFSSDGKTVATLHSFVENQRQAGMVILWNVEDGKEVRQIKAEADNFGAIGSIAFAPVGKTLAWTRYDGVVRLVDPESGKETKQMGQAQQGIFFNTLVFSPDGKVLATRAQNNPVLQLWDVENGKELRTLGDAINPQQGNVIIRSYGGVGGPNNVAFSPDGKQLAEGLPTNTVRLWEVASGKEIIPVSGHQGGVGALSVSPDGKTLFTYGSDNTIRQWDMTSGKELRQVKLPAGTGAVALSADGKLAAAGAPNNAVGIHDVMAGKELRTITIPGQQNFVGLIGGNNGLALTPDGKTLAVRGFDATIRLFETATGRELNPLSEQQPNANNANGVVFVSSGYYGVRPLMVFSPDGTLLATLGSAQLVGQPGVIVAGRPQQANTMVRLWNVTHGKPIGRLDLGQRGVGAMAFSPDGFSIATANTDNTISLWEVATGKECLKITLKKDDKPAPQPAVDPAKPAIAPAIARLPNQGVSSISSLAIAADGRTLAAGGIDRTLYLFDLATGKDLGKFTGHEGNVLNVLFAPDSRTLISGSADTTAMVWDGGRYIARDVPPTGELNAAQLDELWKDLGTDGEKWYKALGKLAGAPKQAVTLFAERVKPATGIEAKKLEQLVKDLDSNDFETREKATAELEKLGEIARPALDRILKSQPALETQQRVERIIEKMVTGQPPPPEVLRSIRAVRVLQMIGSPEAKQLLATLAKGAPGDRLTVEADAVLQRLK
jgi:RNA polymerase sigma factor (sigma-70 family)